MTKEMKQELERFGRVETDYATWVHPWREYWRLYCKSHHDLLIKVLSKKYPDFYFYHGESHICNTIYHVIKIDRK